MPNQSIFPGPQQGIALHWRECPPQHRPRNETHEHVCDEEEEEVAVVASSDAHTKVRTVMIMPENMCVDDEKNVTSSSAAAKSSMIQTHAPENTTFALVAVFCAQGLFTTAYLAVQRRCNVICICIRFRCIALNIQDRGCFCCGPERQM